MKFSQFAKKFTKPTGISQLMEDIKAAADRQALDGTRMNMLGVGNPASIAEVNTALMASYQNISQNAQGSSALDSLTSYAPPQGDLTFIQALVDFFNRHYGWGICSDNVAITNGSQNGFFYLFNMFSGKFDAPAGSEKHHAQINKSILLPLVPDYVGYGDVQIDGQYFISAEPIIELTEFAGMQGFFKYRVNFDAIEHLEAWQTGQIGAICCSRPTNPSGNVLTDDEIMRLDKLASRYDVPLIIDNAYGMPFPNIINTSAKLYWHENIILCFSLSKVGLPGVRTGIIIAQPDVIRTINSLNAITNLAPTRFGATLATPLIQDDSIISLANQYIQPYYQNKAKFTISLLQKELQNYPLYIHQPEGAIFLWLWFKDLPISTTELYEQLKKAGTLIIPSEYFFLGIDTKDYRHAHECIRMSIATDEASLADGIKTIGRVVRQIYNHQYY